MKPFFKDSKLSPTSILDLSVTQARYIKNKPIVNRDPQAAKLAEMQDEIQVGCQVQ
jgi:hypothetical protein